MQRRALRCIVPLIENKINIFPEKEVFSMAYNIEEKLVIGVASSALFRLDEADEIFRSKGLAAYRAYQREHQNDILRTGIAYPFIKRFLHINEIFPEEHPVDVVLLSHNDPDTGARVMQSIRHYNLPIHLAAFTTGASPYAYIPAYNVSLFLSANENDVRQAASQGFAAGQVLDSAAIDDENDHELRIAFDFDGVIADDSAEMIYKAGGLALFHMTENANAANPLPQGPLAGLLSKLAKIRAMEEALEEKDPAYQRFLKTAIVTARSAPADQRIVSTLRQWDISVDQTFLLGGIDKGRALSILKPHIFFDDQRHPHLDSSSPYTPSVHIPFGVLNNRKM